LRCWGRAKHGTFSSNLPKEIRPGMIRKEETLDRSEALTQLCSALDSILKLFSCPETLT
jgi:hypothetical protein